VPFAVDILSVLTGEQLKRCVHKLSKLQKVDLGNHHWSCGHANG